MTDLPLDNHFFRHEYGRLVAMLSCRIGVEHIEDIEDAVQSALLSAVENWTVVGLPDNPSAWLFRVAYNNFMGELRKRARRRRNLKKQVTQDLGSERTAEVFFSGELQDELLQMLFVCCDDAIPLESQLVFALKTLCGFDVREIAVRLFTSETNVYKRLARARSRLRETDQLFGEVTSERYSARLPAVHKVLYLLFTEGYLSSDAQIALRVDLCREALRLAGALADHLDGKTPETHALLALMHLHSARMASREDEAGMLLLLEEQDRSLWDQDRIQLGLHWLAKSAEGDVFSRYHAEAGIAAEHCLAPSFKETRWEKVAECYSLLEQCTDSPIHRLNRALAVAEWKGPEEGFAILGDLEPPGWLEGSYLWSAVLADLHRRSGSATEAAHYRRRAMETAPTPKLKDLLWRRLSPINDD